MQKKLSYILSLAFLAAGVAVFTPVASAQTESYNDAYCQAVYGDDTHYSAESRGCVLNNVPPQVLGIKITASNPLGLSVGTLVKNKKFAEVFYVNSNYELQWIKNEAAAEKRFGKSWNTIIHEFDAITGYSFGATISD